MVKGVVVQKGQKIPMNRLGEILSDTPSLVVKIITYNTKDKYILGFTFYDSDHTLLILDEYSKDDVKYNFYKTFEEFKKDVDNICKNYYDKEYERNQKEFNENVEKLGKTVKELKDKLLKVGEINGKLKRK